MLILAFFSVLFSFNTQTMVLDNRFFSLLQYPYIKYSQFDSHAAGDFFISTASHAADDINRDVGIAELSGRFDQSQLGYSFILAGLANPLPPLFIDGQLPWNLEGKLQAQGFAFSYEQYLAQGISVGLFGLAMRSNSYIDFYFDKDKSSSLVPILTTNDIGELDDIRRAMLAQLGLTCNHVHQGGVGDTEVYVRWAQYYEYCLKLRSLNYGLRVGALIPTGVKRNILQPASVPFGGNGHWGIYGSIDGEFEIKEDWKIGGWIRLSKRFAKTMPERLPVDNEPQIFGVVQGLVKINPGLTTIFCLYGQWEGIRDGLGVRVQYSLINHNHDDWTDERIDKTIPVKLEPVEKRSDWASEYITLSAFYDFEKLSEYRCGNKPIVRVMWDIPVTLLVAHRFVKSYKVSLGLEFNF